MVEKIKENKDKVLAFMEQELSKYGNSRMDVKQIGELADIVKDLAAAEESCWKAQYYRTVTEAMERGSGSSGYTPIREDTGRMGYGGMSGRRGYDSASGGDAVMGHSDPMAIIRSMLDKNPGIRSQLINELM